MSVLLRKTISFPEEVGTRFGEEARIDSCHFSPDRICFCLLRHLLNRAWNVSSFCGEDGERCQQKKSVCRPSTMKLLEQPEQSIKWIYALEPSVIQSVYHMKFWSYSSLVLLFSGSFISLAACSQLRQTEGYWFLSIRRVSWMVMIIFSTSWSVSSFSVRLRLRVIFIWHVRICGCVQSFHTSGSDVQNTTRVAGTQSCNTASWSHLIVALLQVDLDWVVKGRVFDGKL